MIEMAANNEYAAVTPERDLINNFRDDLRYNPDNKDVSGLTAEERRELLLIEELYLRDASDQKLDIHTCWYLKEVTKNKPVKRLRGNQRDSVTITVYEDIWKSDKPKGADSLSWSRFQITCSLLFSSGMRVNEAASITKEQILNCLESRQMDVHEKKTSSIRTVVSYPVGLLYIKEAFEAYRPVVYKKHDVLYPAPSSGRKNNEKFCGIINKFLKP